jgi:DNA-binding response OmpR family regulator
MKLLVVEDEERMAALLRRGLGEEGHVVDLCSTAEEAFEQGVRVAYDVIVLDWSLPGADGVSLLRRWRDQGLRTPVLMLTARGSSGEKVTGLRAGADDYLVKPFDFEEFLARLEALQRRSAGQPTDRRAGPVVLVGRRRVLSWHGKEESLTAREFALCDELFAHVGEVLSRTRLLSSVWGDDVEVAPNVVEVYIGYLRTKLERLGDHGVVIRTVRGIGYRVTTSSAS